MLRHLFKLTVQWGWRSADKAAGARAVKLLNEPPGRVRYLTPDEQGRLFGGLGKATLSMSPGLWAAEMGQSEDQTLSEVTVAREGAWDSLKLGSIDPVAMSELVRELTAAFGP